MPTFRSVSPRTSHSPAVPGMPSRTKARLGALASLALVIGACGGPLDEPGPDENTAVVSSELKNGSTYDGTNKWKGVLRLQIMINGEWSPCTAVVGSRSTMVTAAHCVSAPLAPYTSGNVRVLARREVAAGSSVIVFNGWAFAKYNPAYNGGVTRYDVAVLTTPSPLANVASDDAVAFAKGTMGGQPMFALGYGYYDNGQPIDGLGRSAQITPTYDSALFEYRYTISRTSDPQMCAGDSGGPIKRVDSHWKIYGIMSKRSGGNNGDACRPTGHWAPTSENWPWLEAAIGYVNCTSWFDRLACW